mmetsp:Transcript_5767/g.12207  ORF Transcript_5767/g.12207 Transcript_5767/m.12207 type:complete len:852 (-) Transcript_5767:1139-3694(-)|eukprot:CAMPEP_0113300230 /NCGR_PEP_ID=MMETSP0010_2-20120614/1949_1 /TAXON_ID=216773 ORGANISM="Corethron hystrix, Strain 308" /NCGR_SAMPLE_ID=MMETSP0010_2 /ASSEMBLY_ACC=CAM_ASM_000155 /LENGTH=851 /DNA_ID=CAMNT_0000153625 /DNA_START=360 /DNA_END=2915 /DNA_ORIENTATION=+ /assembly_acc=CAM_ASM_000155
MDQDDTSQTASENDSITFERSRVDVSSQESMNAHLISSSQKSTTFRDGDGSGGKTSKSISGSMFQQPKTRASSGTSAGYNTRAEDKLLAQIGCREREKESGSENRQKTARDETVNFLESLTEEERRTRTRFLPDIDGFSMLTKVECKSDLKAARSLTYKSNRKDGPTDSGTGLDDDTSKSVLRRGPFVPPLDEEMIGSSVYDDENADKKDDGNTSGKSDECKIRGRNGLNLMAPFMVESMTAFNPLRPPESGGTSKKRRLNRWEKHPAEIDTDLETYKCTVEQTRKELRRCEAEREKVEAVGQVLKCHFLQHIKLLRQENSVLDFEMKKIQSIHANEADLISTRRRRGNAVKDAIMVLKSYGDKIRDKKGVFPVSCTEGFNFEGNNIRSGIGGIAPYIEAGTQQETPLNGVANGWIIPGNKVRTPYGCGVVIEVVEATLIKDYEGDGDLVRSMESVFVNIGDSLQSIDKNSGDQSYSIQIIPSRFVVQLPFGIAYMMSSELELDEDPSTYSDAQLCARWRAMAKTALSTSGYIDSMAMRNFLSDEGYDEISDGPSEQLIAKLASNVPEKENGIESSSQNTRTSSIESIDDHGVVNASTESGKHRLLKFGDTLLPTPGGRGAPASDLPIGLLTHEIDKKVDTIFTKKGFLASDSALVTPEGFCEWENERIELYEYKAKLMQLQNTLRRQIEYRTQNEKLINGMGNNYERLVGMCEDLQADLQRIKESNRQDLREHGITDTEAYNIYLLKSRQSKEVETHRPKKKGKKGSENPFNDISYIQPRASRRKAEEAARAKDHYTISRGDGNDNIQHTGDLEKYSHGNSKNCTKRSHASEENGTGNETTKPKRNNRRP